MRRGGPMMEGASRYAMLALVSAVTVAVDQFTKVEIMQTMRLHESIPVVPEFFSLTYIRNPGAAFGLLASSSQGFRLVFFGLTSLFALGLLGMIFFRLRGDDWIGQVIDFLDFYVNGYHWPAFNVADAAISVGVFFLILHFALDKKEPHAEPVLQQDVHR